jgi:hypothetical protein
MNGSNEIHDSEWAVLKDGLQALLYAPTWAAKREILQTRPELVTDSAVRVLEELSETAQNETGRDYVLAHRDLLHRCQEMGVESAFKVVVAVASEVAAEKL